MSVQTKEVVVAVGGSEGGSTVGCSWVIDKVARAFPAAARMESGHLYFLQGASWRERFERELLSFPAGTHDDMVDCLACAVTQTVKGQGQIWMEYWMNLVKERADEAAFNQESWSTESPPSRHEVAAE
jgi:phage terminase large subunit-like protein